MQRQHKILIVEDDPSNTELFIDILSIGGYDCTACSNGKEAIEIAKKEKYDLILLDIQLPDIDGFEIKNILRSYDETRNLKIIALTAYAMKGDREMFLEKGFDGYISKPIKMKEFLDTVKNYLSQ